jgi:hypothetical protein
MDNDNYDQETKQQYKTSIAQLPLSPLEDPRLQQTSPERLSTDYGHRWSGCFLSSMEMCALTVLDDDSKILAVLAAMFRRKESDTRHHVVSLTLEMVAAGMKAGKHPDATVTVLDGDEARRDYTIKMVEIPWLSAYMGRLLPTAAGWGIMKGYLDPLKRMDGHLPNSKNAEQYLDPRTWKEVKGMVVPGSSASDLMARLAPSAREFAENHVTAWDPFLAACQCFGGFDKATIPKIIGAPPVLVRELTGEGEMRKAAKVKRDSARTARYSAQHGGGGLEVHAAFEGSVAAAFDAAKEDGAA